MSIYSPPRIPTTPTTSCSYAHTTIPRSTPPPTSPPSMWAPSKTAKRHHERRIRKATAMVKRERTVVLRVIGDIYGNTVQCTRLEATSACLRTGDRFPNFALAVDHATIECDLRGRPSEQAGSDTYFADACLAIDELVDGRLRDGIARDHIGHVSVFAFARLPLLVYLGSKLDDSFSTDIYQRSRRTQSWDWPNTADAERLRRRDTSTLTCHRRQCRYQRVGIYPQSRTPCRPPRPPHLHHPLSR